MKWKSVKKNKPMCSIMGKSQYDLLMFDGYNYHRGYATYNQTPHTADCLLVKPRYFSIDLGDYITPLSFLEIAPPKKASLTNVWSKVFKKEMKIKKSTVTK